MTPVEGVAVVLAVSIVAAVGAGCYVLGRAREREVQVAARQWLLDALARATKAEGDRGPA